MSEPKISVQAIAGRVVFIVEWNCQRIAMAMNPTTAMDFCSEVAEVAGTLDPSIKAVQDECDQDFAVMDAMGIGPVAKRKKQS